MSRLSLAYGVVFLGQGAHLPFFPLWLAAQGLDPAQIGLVLALPLIQRTLTMPVMSALASSLGGLKWGLTLYAGLGTAFVLLYLVPGGGVVFIGAVTIALALVWMPMTPVLDALTIARARFDGFDYGVVRAWGSVAFGAAVLGVGVMIEALGVEILIPLLAVYFASCAAIFAALPRDPPSADPRPSLNPREGFLLLWSKPGLVPTLVGCALVQASHAMFYGLGSVHWRALGHSETMIGLAWGVAVAAEIALLFVSGRLVARFGLPALMALGAGGATLRWTLLSLDPALPILIASQVLHGASFAATHIATVNLIASSVPGRFGAVAQGAYFALLGGLNGLSFLMIGPLYQSLHGAGFAAMAGLAIIAGGLIAMGTRRRGHAGRR